jgi:hypothetical protein
MRLVSEWLRAKIRQGTSLALLALASRLVTFIWKASAAGKPLLAIYFPLSLITQTGRTISTMVILTISARSAWLRRPWERDLPLLREFYRLILRTLRSIRFSAQDVKSRTACLRVSGRAVHRFPSTAVLSLPQTSGSAIWRANLTFAGGELAKIGKRFFGY